MYSDEYKQQVYKRWVERGRPWFDIDKTKEPTWEERQIILEMKKQELSKSKYEQELEQRAKDARETYGKKGKISDKIFNVFDY